MLVYIVTVAVSAFFVPHYLSIFWEPLRHEPLGHRRRRDRDRRARRAQRRRRHRRPRKLSISARRGRLRDPGAARDPRLRPRLQPGDARRRTSTGAWRRPGPTSRSRSRSRCSRTPASRRSRTSQRRRATRRARVPNAYKLVAVAVFAIYFTLPLIALSALPVKLRRRRVHDAARAAARGGRLRERPDPRRRPEPRARGRAARRGSRSTSGVLAATILFVATNAGVIGASRITYSMATLPADAGGLPPAPPTAQDAVALARRLRRDRADPDPASGRRELRRHALLARCDALVHGRARGPRPDPDGR